MPLTEPYLWISHIRLFNYTHNIFDNLILIPHYSPIPGKFVMLCFFKHKHIDRRAVEFMFLSYLCMTFPISEDSINSRNTLYT